MSVNNPRLESIPVGKSGQELQTAGHITSQARKMSARHLHCTAEVEMTFVDMSSPSEILLMLDVYGDND